MEKYRGRIIEESENGYWEIIGNVRIFHEAKPPQPNRRERRRKQQRVDRLIKKKRFHKSW